MARLTRLSSGALSLALCMALTPAVFTAGPWIENRFFPVVVGAEVGPLGRDEMGVEFDIRFEKVRPCEFLGLAWYEGPVRMAVDFGPTEAPGPIPATRPMGMQHAGPWRIWGLESLTGTRAYTMHRCHPLWITITDFYQG